MGYLKNIFKTSFIFSWQDYENMDGFVSRKHVLQHTLTFPAVGTDFVVYDGYVYIVALNKVMLTLEAH